MNIIGFSGLHHSVTFKRKYLPNLPPRAYRIAQGFDSAASLVTKNGVVAAAAEERFTGEKTTGKFPVNAFQYCLLAGSITPNDVDYVAHAFSYEPFHGFYNNSPFAREQFKHVYSHETQLSCLQAHFPDYRLERKFIPVEHHLAHAASTFYLSGFKESLILIADGMGEIHSTTIALGQENDIRVIRQIRAPHSLGILYSVLTLFLGFECGMDEYKVMGLAPYGNPNRYFNTLMDFVHLQTDGTYLIPILAQNATLEEKETYSGTLRILANTFGPPREPGAEITQEHKDIAAALQSTLEATIMHMLRHFRNETGQGNLCTAGGVALNCTANGVINRSRMFKGLFIQPAAADDGAALGAALYVQRLHEPEVRPLRMRLPLWGPRFALDTIEEILGKYLECEWIKFESFDDLSKDIASRILSGQVVAWFQGRMEFGPRALGNRSILADPRDPRMRDHLNSIVKERESFRPFAPVVTAEAAAEIFEVAPGEELLFAYMLVSTPVRPAYRERIPAVTHVNGSARVQVVLKEDNPKLWTLLNDFASISSLPVLVNTSFNLRGQPIVRTPIDALDTYLRSRIDLLVIEDYLIMRRATSDESTG